MTNEAIIKIKDAEKNATEIIERAEADARDALMQAKADCSARLADADIQNARYYKSERTKVAKAGNAVIDKAAEGALEEARALCAAADSRMAKAVEIIIRSIVRA